MYEEEQIEPNFRKRPENPFRIPERYFDTLEGRIMAGIEHSGKTKSKSAKLIRLMKPILSMAASLSLVYLLVYYPINHFRPQNTLQTAQTGTNSSDIPEAYSLSFLSVDENTLLNTITAGNTSSSINPDDLVAYLSTGTNDVQLYSEIQN